LGLFDKLGRQASTPHEPDDPGSGTSGRPPSSLSAPDEHDAVRHPADLPTVPMPIVPPSSPRTAPEVIEPRYDPSHPNQRPVAGIDLPTFASLRRQLANTTASEQRLVLVAHGLTPETWQAVSTAWVARLGQMPFLHATYVAAHRSS
jgi:hypothetical protein